MTPAEAFPQVEKLFRFYANRFTLHRPQLREDLFQESVCLFFARFGYFDGNPHHLPKFVRWTCLLAAKRTFRQGSRWPQEFAARTGRLPDDKMFPAPDAPAPDFERAEVAAAVRAAVDGLPAPGRAIVRRLYGLDGRPPANCCIIARERGCTGQNVSNRHRRILARLAADLAEREGGALC